MSAFENELKRALTEAKSTLNSILTEIEAETDQTLKEMLKNIINAEQTEEMTIYQIKSRINEFTELYKQVKIDVAKANHKKVAETLIESFKHEAISHITRIKSKPKPFKKDFILYEITRSNSFFKRSGLSAIGEYGITGVFKPSIYRINEAFCILKALLTVELSGELMQHYSKGDIELSLYTIDALRGWVIGKKIMARMKLISNVGEV